VLQARKEQAAAQVKQLQERLSQAPQPEELSLLKNQLQTALSAQTRLKALEQRVAQVELTRQQDRAETKASFTWIVENQEEKNRALKEALRSPRSVPPPQEKNITPPVVPPSPSRPEQPQVRQRELTIQEMNAVAERVQARYRMESPWEAQERTNRKIVQQQQKIYLVGVGLFLVPILMWVISMWLTHLLGQFARRGFALRIKTDQAGA
jgi:hypothetical protein